MPCKTILYEIKRYDPPFSFHFSIGNFQGVHVSVPSFSHTFPQQRKFGVFSHSKGPGAGRSRPEQPKSPGSQVPRKGFPSKVPRKKFPSKVPKRFSSRVPMKRFPSKRSQEEVRKQGFPGRGSQTSVPRKRFASRYLGRCSQARLGCQELLASTVSKSGSQAIAKQGSQESKVATDRFPSKVSRNRFTSKGSKNSASNSQAMVPRTGFHAR